MAGFHVPSGDQVRKFLHCAMIRLADRKKNQSKEPEMSSLDSAPNLTLLSDTPIFNRRLAAVAFADVAGWTRLVGQDDIATLLAWKAMRSDLIEPLIREHGGELMEIHGDAVLVQFQSAVAAVCWALDIQRGAGTLPEHGGRARLKLRIGINVEDVIVDDGKLIGDGVNIAARIHQAAEEGEIVVTEMVREFVHNKVSAAMVDLGSHHLKNVSRAIRVFRVDPHVPGASSLPAHAQPSMSWAKRPGIAVLPFRTIGGETGDAYFGEGITEDIINALARSHSFYVIARNSTLRYREEQGDLRQVAAELGVRYVLQGSVRRSAARLRITCELIDASTLTTVWAEKFDGANDDIFEFQDRIAASTVGKIEPRLIRAEAERALQKPTENLGAYDCVLRAFALIYTFDRRDFAEAGRFLERAVELDPSYAQAHAWLAWWCNLAAGEGYSADPVADRLKAERASQTSVNLDPDDAFCLAVAAHVQAFLAKKLDDAAEMFDRAVLLNENCAFAWGMSASTYCYLGKSDEALERLRNAWRLSPFDPLNFVFLTIAGIAEFGTGRYDQAIAWLRKSERANPRFSACCRTLAATLAISGDLDGARRAALKLLSIEPGFRISVFKSWYPMRDSERLKLLVDGLRLAGLPE